MEKWENWLLENEKKIFAGVLLFFIILILAIGIIAVYAGQITVQGTKEGAVHGNAALVQGEYAPDSEEISPGGSKHREDSTSKLREDGTDKLRES